MKIIVSAAELMRNLGVIAGVAPAKSVLPIIQNIHFQIIEGRLYLTATDLENSMQTSLDVEVADGEGQFNVAIPAKIIQDTLKALPEQPVSLEQPKDTFEVRMVTDNGSYKINGVNGEDFPQIALREDTTQIPIPRHVMVKAINKVLFAASPDDLKPAMTGMFFDFTEEHTTFVATDAHRLVRYRRLDLNAPHAVNFVLPQKALKLVNAASGASAEDTVQLEFNERNAFFSFGETLIVCRLIDAQFPNYETVIPKGSPNKVIINKKDLIATIKRLDIYSNKTTHLGRFKFIGNNLEVKSEDIDFHNEAQEKLSCLYDGEEIEIGFNVDLMRDVIHNVETEDVVLEMDTPGRAAVVLPTEDEANEEVLMLLMPVMLTHQ